MSKPGRTWRILVLTAIFAALAVAVMVGWFDFLAFDGHLERAKGLAFAACCWLASCVLACSDPRSWRPSPPALWLLAGLTAIALVLVACAALSLGGFLGDRDGVLHRGTALKAILLYWGIGCAAVLAAGVVRRKWRESALAAASVVVGLLVLEGGMRVLLPYRAMVGNQLLKSSRHHHGYPPDSRMYQGTFDGEPVVIETNEDGFRTSYSREAFLSYPVRVAVLGDSYVFGLGVRQDRVFCQVMEDLLRERLEREDIAVLNAGVTSYSPLLHTIRLAGDLAAYRPTHVVLLLDPGDFGDDYKYEQELRPERADGRFAFEDERLPAIHSAVYQELDRLVGMTMRIRRLGRLLAFPFSKEVRSRPPAPVYDYYAFKVTVEGVTETDRYFIYRHPLEETRPFFERTLGYVEQLDGQAEGMGAKFLLVVSPRYHHWNPAECPDNWERNIVSGDEPYQYEYLTFFDSAAEGLEFPVLNLLPAFRETDEFPLVFAHDPHWNADGHAFVGREIAEYLVTSGFLD